MTRISLKYKLIINKYNLKIFVHQIKYKLRADYNQNLKNWITNLKIQEIIKMNFNCRVI